MSSDTDDSLPELLPETNRYMPLENENEHEEYRYEEGYEEYEEYEEYGDEHAQNDIFCSICEQPLHPLEVESHMADHRRSLNTLSSLVSLVPSSAFFHRLTSQLPPLHSYRTTINSYAGPDFFNLVGVYGFASQDFHDFNDYEANLRLADMIGTVEIGVQDIDKVGTVIHNSALNDDTVCAICLESPKTQERDGRQLLCQHTYCKNCIDEWLEKHKTCPVCKLDLDEHVANLNTRLDHSQQLQDLPEI